ncbi:hypothetical protein KR018_003121 [Drosophila ironensis]|nr:hypothetical protein KR018_003121 [Drosophila ironensis]
MLDFLEGLRRSAGPGDMPVEHIYRQFFAPLHERAREPAARQPNKSLLEDFDAEASNQADAPPPGDQDVWIFGYGSLVWKADFPYIDRRRGYIGGFKRRFYQHSIDHRGTPERPGRVVTLLPGDSAQDRVYGVAYRIASNQKSEVLSHLDYREKNGYERCSLRFHEYPRPSSPSTGDGIQVIMYVATQANDSYAGDVWQVGCIARQIFTSAGPSGPNREYLFNLAAAMEQLFPGAVDEHLDELVTHVRRFVEEEEPQLLRRALLKEIGAVLGAETSQEQQAHRLEELRKRCLEPGGREWLLYGQLQDEGEA